MKIDVKKTLLILKQKKPFNYFYFLILLTFLLSLNIKLFFSLENPLSILFLLYAVGQALFEVGSFIFIMLCIRKWAPKWVGFIFIGFSFILCLIHFTDFTLIRLMDAPISYLFKFLFYSGFLKVLEALNLNLSMIMMTVSAIILVPMAGPIFYWLTNRISKKKPFPISIFQIGTTLILIGISLFSLDLLAHPFLNRPNYAKLQKTLPFKGTFLHPSPQCVQLPSSITPARKEPELNPSWEKIETASLPNIYLFVIETLRRDFLDEKTAPHMMNFAKENHSFPHSFANSCGTHTSWFAIFHADYPYHWTDMRDSWNEGSVPLRLLKQLGYQINVYSAANLRYFEMDQLLFGEKRQLIDKIAEFSAFSHLKSCDRDALAMERFAEDIRQPKGKKGNVYLFFLDSTHSEYSFPKDFKLRFEPIVEQIDYLTLTKKEIEPLKNRYRNSIGYVDDLVGNFFSLLQREKIYDEAIITITGDHGEEFFEEGALFHGTHLNFYQTHVPIFCKFPQTPGPILTNHVSHMDIFPSILHILTGKEDFSNLFDGQSLFQTDRWPYRLAVLQNGPDTPFEFAILDEKRSLHMRFLTHRNIYQEVECELLDFEIPEKVPAHISLNRLVELYFPHCLEPLIKTPATNP